MEQDFECQLTHSTSENRADNSTSDAVGDTDSDTVWGSDSVHGCGIDDLNVSVALVFPIGISNR